MTVLECGDPIGVAALACSAASAPRPGPARVEKWTARRTIHPIQAPPRPGA